MSAPGLHTKSLRYFTGIVFSSLLFTMGGNQAFACANVPGPTGCSAVNAQLLSAYQALYSYDVANHLPLPPQPVLQTPTPVTPVTVPPVTVPPATVPPVTVPPVTVPPVTVVPVTKVPTNNQPTGKYHVKSDRNDGPPKHHEFDRHRDNDMMLFYYGRHHGGGHRR